MKQILLLIYCWMFLTYQLFSQTIDWITSEPYPNYITFTNKAVSDLKGNIYICGEIRSGGTYVIKYNKDGNKLWEKIYQGNNSFKNLCTDEAGNLYAVIRFSKITIDGIEYQKRGNFFNIFIKYDENGNVFWLKETELALNLSDKTDTEGNLIITGWFMDTVKINNNLTFIAPPQKSRLFLAKFNPNGECIWAIPDDGANWSSLILANNFMFAADWFTEQNFTLGKGNNEVTLNKSEGSHYFALYKPNGDLQWVKQIMTVPIPDNFGNYYCFINDSNPGVGTALHKYDKDGNLLWKGLNLYIDKPYKGGAACDESGNLFVAGGFANYMTIGDTTIYGHNDYRLFVAKLDSSGALKWVITSEGPGGAGTKDIAVRGNEIYITGDIGGEIKIGNHTTYQEQGVFTLKIIDNDKPTNVTKQVKETGFNIFPNPTHSNFTIHYQSEKTSTISFKVRTLTGAIIYEAIEQKPTGKIEKQINLGSPAPGVYFVEVMSDGERVVKKVVVGR